VLFLEGAFGEGWLGEGWGVLRLLIVGCGALTVLALGLSVAAVVSHLAAKWRKQARRQDREQWQQALLDVLAGAVPPEYLSDQVGLAQRRRFLSFLVEHATTVTGSALERIRAVARPFLQFAEKDLRAGPRMVRAQAVRRIGLLGGPDYIPMLEEALDDRSDFVSFIAFQHLARWSGPDEAPRLLGAVSRLSRVDRVQLVSALVEVGEEAAPLFREELRNEDRTPFERAVCAETLRWLGDGDAAPVAFDLLKTPDADPELTAALLRLLSRVGSAQHAVVVRSHCRSDVSFVRIQATRALGKLGGEEDVACLTDRIRNDPSRWVALSAAQSLADLGRTDELRRLSANGEGQASTIASDLLPAEA
jgi:HEAT repeat protein